MAEERNELDGNANDDDELASSATTTAGANHDEATETEETLHERQYREQRQRQQQLDRINMQRQRQLDSQESAARLASGQRASSGIAEPATGPTSAQSSNVSPEPGAREHRRRHHHHHHHHNHHHHRNHHHHPKEMIKADPTERRARSVAQAGPLVRVSKSPGRFTAIIPARSSSANRESAPGLLAGAGTEAPPVRQVATVVDEEQLHRRLMQSVSEKRLKAVPAASEPLMPSAAPAAPKQQQARAGVGKVVWSGHQLATQSGQSREASYSNSSGMSASSSSHSNRHTTGFQLTDDTSRSPPPLAKIIIPPNVARSLSLKAAQNSARSRGPSGPKSPDSLASLLTREQLDYGPLLKSNEVQVLYRSPEPVSGSLDLDRQLKEEQAKQVAPNLKQSPVAIMSINPAYELQNKPLVIEYPATVENLRLNNTGFSWEVKIPYQISMTTALFGAHLNQSYRYRLDQFHCHWGDNAERGGSEHTVDNRSYSAELHFVHYNMEKYHTLSKAARHPDGLVVLSVFVDAHPDHHNHAELDKIVSHLKSIQLKGEHSIIRHAVRIDNLLPTNKSYWSYQGSLTTPPYLESVTWFVLKYPIRCNSAQIDKFRSLSSSVRRDDDQVFIKSNHRKTQPLNGRTIVMYDEPTNAPSSQTGLRNV